MNEPLYCVNHPKVETMLRCNKCGQPICAKCAVRTPVGYRCRDCVRNQQKAFYADFRPSDYLVAVAVAIPLAVLAAWLITQLTWYTIILGPIAGGAIANIVHRVVGRRRGEYTWLAVCGSIAAGALPQLAIAATNLLVTLSGGGIYPVGFTLLRLVWVVVYIVTSTGAAYAWLRSGRTI